MIGVPVVTIVDPHTRRRRDLEGTVIAAADTRGRDQPRWNELKIWKVPRDGGGPPRWVYTKAGMSVVYHRADTPCETASGYKSGHPATVDDLPDDAEPCWKCSPPYPESLRDGEEVRFEKPRLTSVQLDTPAEVIAEATTKVDRNRRVSVLRSEPVDRLLTQALDDRDFRAGAGDLPDAV
jgi:hypothetical protein